MLARMILVLTAAVLMAVPASAATPAQTCESSKNKLAGAYDLCRQKAEAKFAVTADGAARTLALQKCLDKYNAVWPTLEARAAGACPSNGDQSAIQNVIDENTTNIATALAGGTLQDCPADLATCQGDLSTCQDDLSTEQADLATCDNDLSTCDADLATCQGDLATAQGDLSTCDADLAACQAAPQGQPLKTGETLCWDASGIAINTIPCAGTEQDGELQKGLARSYTDNGDGTITDNRTGLTWEKLSADGSIHDVRNTYSWSDALLARTSMLNSMKRYDQKLWIVEPVSLAAYSPA
jgi:hypothetical protein